MAFEDSKTYQNLQSAYIEKLISSSKYEIYSTTARREGFVEIGNKLDVIRGNEIQHAIIWLRKMNQGNLPNTLENLQSAELEENRFGMEVYQEYARIAREEGYDDIDNTFIGIGNIDLSHELKLERLENNVEQNEVFCKPDNALWICTVCGNIMGGKCAPEICPICGYPQGYYKTYNEIC